MPCRRHDDSAKLAKKAKKWGYDDNHGEKNMYGVRSSNSMYLQANTKHECPYRGDGNSQEEEAIHSLAAGFAKQWSVHCEDGW